MGLAAQPNGQWLFVSDGSGIDIGPCPIAADGLCGVLVKLPKATTPITPTERKQLCGMTMLGSLKFAAPKPSEQFRLDGWVLDPEDLARTDQPKRYSASFVMTSDMNARLDIRGSLNIVIESHRLMRPVAPSPACE
jgi:hypothetical protein